MLPNRGYVHNVKEKVSTSSASKGSTTQVTEVLKCIRSQCSDSDSGVVQYTLWYRYCNKCCGIPDEALVICEHFDSLHWHCVPCDIEVLKC